MNNSTPNIYFSSQRSADKVHTSLNYAWATGAIATGVGQPITGNFIPLQSNDKGALLVDIQSGINIANLNVTGITFDTTALESVGVQTNKLLTGVSGQLAGILSTNTNVTNSILAISGNTNSTIVGIPNVNISSITAGTIIGVTGNFINNGASAITGVVKTNDVTGINFLSGISGQVDQVNHLISITNGLLISGINVNSTGSITGVVYLDVGDLKQAIGSGNAYLASISGNTNIIATGEIGSYSSVLTGVTSGQFQIPIGTRSYSILVESGFAYVNGFLCNSNYSLNGGGYPGRISSNIMNIGCTGTAAIPARVIIYYET